MFTTKGPSAREIEITMCEEQFAEQISIIKNTKANIEKRLGDEEKNIDATEKNIKQLQTEYNLLKTKVKSSKEQNYQDKSLIQKMEKDKSDLKLKLRHMNAALEVDKTEYCSSLECMLRNEELLKYKLTMMADVTCQLRKDLKEFVECLNNLKHQHERKLRMITVQLELLPKHFHKRHMNVRCGNVFHFGQFTQVY